MRVGISLTSSYPGTEFRAGARMMVERARAAREAGLDSLFVGDHHSMSQPYYQNVPILGRLLADWGDRPAGCLFLLPLWNPVLVAEQVGTLASIHSGRFILQCAVGDGGSQFRGMGASPRTRPSAFEESLATIRALLAGETVDGGRRFAFQAARVSPRAPEPIEVWIGGSVEASIDRAARLGDGWLAGPELTPGRAERFLSFYLERSKAHGRVPAAVAIRRDIFVGETDEHARAVAEPIIAAGYRGFDPSGLVFGSPATVVTQLRRYEAMGFTDVIVRHLTNDQSSVIGSMARLGEVREALAS